MGGRHDIPAPEPAEREREREIEGTRSFESRFDSVSFLCPCLVQSTEDRWSGTMPTTDRKDVAMSVARAVAARPGKPGQDPAANPKHAAAFDDANWTLIDAREC